MSLFFGLDDFYLTQSERKLVLRSAETRVIYATRGPPGTHDVAKLLHAINELMDAGRSVEVPQFDKGADERIRYTKD